MGVRNRFDPAREPQHRSKRRRYPRELSDGYKATNVTLLTLIRRAYGIEIRNQISGGPNWLSSDAYDIQAKLDASAADALKKLTPSQKIPRDSKCFKRCLRTASS